MAASHAAETPAPAPTLPSSKLPKKATCPVDGKSVDVTAQSPVIYVNDTPRVFCSTACRDKFAGWPEKYVKETVFCSVQPNFKGWIQTSRRMEVNNNLYFLCCEPCVGYMREKPWFYLKETQDPMNGHWFKPSEATRRSDFKGQIYLFETPETKTQFDKEPEKHVLLFRR
jgi:YHS domain-containing protein